jgi:hypothetical protein
MLPVYYFYRQRSNIPLVQLLTWLFFPTTTHCLKVSLPVFIFSDSSFGYTALYSEKTKVLVFRLYLATPPKLVWCLASLDGRELLS